MIESIKAIEKQFNLIRLVQVKTLMQSTMKKYIGKHRVPAKLLEAVR